MEAKNAAIKPLYDSFLTSPPFLSSCYLIWWWPFVSLRILKYKSSIDDLKIDSFCSVKMANSNIFLSAKFQIIVVVFFLEFSDLLGLWLSALTHGMTRTWSMTPLSPTEWHIPGLWLCSHPRMACTWVYDSLLSPRGWHVPGTMTLCCHPGDGMYLVYYSALTMGWHVPGSMTLFSPWGGMYLCLWLSALTQEMAYTYQDAFH